ncbi:MAG: efflux transporter periplasmic adaptor subunit, partial [Spirochaetales bacterium]
PMADYFQTNGEVVSASSVEVYPEAAGILSRLYVNLGDTVRKSQVIGAVDPSRAGMNYSLSQVKARTAGTITALPLSMGDAVSMQTPVAVIGNLQKLQVTAAIPERFVSRIRMGMSAEVSLEAWPGQIIPLKVTQINPVVDASSRTMEIKMDVPPDQMNIKPGMFAEVRLTTDEKDNVVKIPADAVLRRLGETFVYVIAGGRAEKRLVVPGITLEGVVEILQGLEEGEVIAWQGQTLLEDGVQVRVNREVQVIKP